MPRGFGFRLELKYGPPILLVILLCSIRCMFQDFSFFFQINHHPMPWKKKQEKRTEIWRIIVAAKNSERTCDGRRFSGSRDLSPSKVQTKIREIPMSTCSHPAKVSFFRRHHICTPNAISLLCLIFCSLSAFMPVHFWRCPFQPEDLSAFGIG